jgi:hypothetical protein
MRSKTFTIMFALAVMGVLSLPQITLAPPGFVKNPRTQAIYSGNLALSDAVAATAPGDTLQVFGMITEPIGVDLTGFSGTIVGVGFMPTISIAVCTPGGAVIDASNRNGQVTLLKFRLLVPDLCIGILDDAAGAGASLPLKIQNLKITGVSPAAVFDGICIQDQFTGPFVISNNKIDGILGNACTTTGDGAITVDGDGTALKATIMGNKVNNLGSGGTSNGITLSDAGAGSLINIKSNIVNGGGAVNGIGAGIFLDGVTGPTINVQFNNVQKYLAPSGIGLRVCASSGVVTAPNTLILNTINGPFC